MNQDMKPPKLEEVAKKCRRVIEKAKKDLGEDLMGYSMLDLVADQIPNLPLRTLEDALVVSGYQTRTDCEHSQIKTLCPICTGV